MFLFKKHPMIKDILYKFHQLGYSVRFINKQSTKDNCVGLIYPVKKIVLIYYKFRCLDAVYFTLCHEFHHAKQYRYGSCYVNNPGKKLLCELKADAFAVKMVDKFKHKSYELCQFIKRHNEGYTGYEQ